MSEADKMAPVASIEMWDKLVALSNLGRHLGMFVDKAEVTTKQLGDRVLELLDQQRTVLGLALRRAGETAPARGNFLVADAVLKNQSAEAEFC